MSNSGKTGAKSNERNFYGGNFTPRELADLASMLETGLESEIAMIRVCLRRYFELVGNAEDLDAAADALGSLGLGAFRLAGLLKVQIGLGGDNAAKTFQGISAAIKIFQEEMDIHT